MPNGLEPITRPDGRLYRPRTLTAYLVDADDEYSVVVLGTHDLDHARRIADEHVRRHLGLGLVAADPWRVWWRDGFKSGRRCWVTDEERGRAGVWFSQIAERMP